MKFSKTLTLGAVFAMSLAAQSSQKDPEHHGEHGTAPPIQNHGNPGVVHDGKGIQPSKNQSKSNSPLTIPANAERLDANHFRAKDDQGVMWYYTKTPFGIIKGKADENLKGGVEDSGGIVATDQGDTVKFEKQTPFGKNSWTKKKTEMNEAERVALENNSPKTTTSSKK